jgi:adenosylcobyric acid synthase
MTASGLLVCGTASNAGKTTIVAALCRALLRRGVRVAPYKAQNMSLNSGVTPSGHEIARAQLLQAVAAGVEPEVAMNPVLIKPGSDQRAHLIVNGQHAGEVDASDYLVDRSALMRAAIAAYDELASRYDVIVAEGAGSGAEINLRDYDIANFGLATAVDLPVVIVTDIDRGGAFASLIGTMECLDAADRRRVRGFVINRFRGDVAVLQPGIDELARRTGVPTFGVVPYSPGLRLDAEDSLATAWTPVPRPPVGPDILRIVVVRLPRASNLTDLEPVAAEPGVVLTFADVPEQMLGADLVVVPGTRATVDDLGWLRDRGFADGLQARAESDLPILGICGGYQMLGETIEDHVESAAGVVPGLGLLPVVTVFAQRKTLAVRAGVLPGGTRVDGYQIHHGRVSRSGGQEMLPDDGCHVGSVSGTTWHGLFESDAFRRHFLADVAAQTHRDFVLSGLQWRRERETQLDHLGHLAEEHLAPLLDELLSPARG